MKAIVLKQQGSPDEMVVAELPIPEPETNQVLIKVKAISINPADTYMRKDPNLLYVFNNEEPKILGWDISGTIEKTGDQVVGYSVRDEVFGLINFPTYTTPGHARGYAEYIVTDPKFLAPKPENITHEQAAASTLAALTAWQPLKKAGLRQGDRVFVTAAGGGVGHFAVQLAKYLGAYVIGLASEDKKELVLRLGADEFIDYKKVRFEDVLDPVDFVFEALGGSHVERTLRVVRPGGSLLSLSSHIEGTPLEELADKLGVNAYYNAVVSDGRDMLEIAGMLEKGTISPHISSRYSLEAMPEAHRELEKGRTAGKIVVIP